METSGPTLRQRSSLHGSSSMQSVGNTSSDAIPPETNDQTSSILSSSVQGASYLVLLQFVSRMLTFTLNQVLLRYTTAETLGIASVQLELLLNTILFLSREGVRCAAIRVSDDEDHTSFSSATPTTSSETKVKAERLASEQEGSHGQCKDTQPAKLVIQPGSEAYRLQKLVNIVYAPIPIGALMTCIAVGYYLYHVNDANESRFPGYRLSICLYGLAALIELLAEPMFMVAQYKLWFKTRVSVEGLAVIVRCVLTCALTVYGARATVPGYHSHEKDTNGNISSSSNTNTMGVLAFAIAQFVYGLLIFGGFLLSFWSKSSEKQEIEKRRMAAAIKRRNGDKATEDQPDLREFDTVSLKALLPRKLVRTTKDGRQESFFFDMELLKLSKTLTAQSLLKHILTEGDKMLMTGFTTKTDQGVYAFVVNYGSLIARILFQPMEETSRTLFSRLLSDIRPKPGRTHNKEDSSVPPGIKDSSADTVHTGIDTLTDTQRGNLRLSLNLLLTIMKFHILLGLIFIAFGTHYTATLIDLVVGRYWSKETPAPIVLSLYCYYVPIMGLNGVTEAVVQAVASEKELGVLSYWMMGFSVVFCSTGAFLMGALGMDARGIVLANCVNLSMRIIWSMWFLSGYYGRYIPTTMTGSGSASTHSRKRASGVLATFAYVPWRNIVPSTAVLSAFGAAYIITAVSEQWIGWERLYNKVLHLGVGVTSFALVMIVVYMAEKQFLLEIRNVVRQKRS
ncbi:Oligosaccharide translocation protein rft1 [Mortierella polycephala]|uniref:Man(5)GlcNAc(2)-PP-dolichol translocation protein RFT1 n=1 Tax=Mortierella polycephala TaxID=41804 RepID=A0A9P6U955_9FUNG|nr:Oligosaccharide translocation protein rft1 [Mortierella polycephala]